MKVVRLSGCCHGHTIHLSGLCKNGLKYNNIPRLLTMEVDLDSIRERKEKEDYGQ